VLHGVGDACRGHDATGTEFVSRDLDLWAYQRSVTRSTSATQQAMALGEPSILCAPLLATAAGPEQSGIIVTDNDCLVDPSLR
jgi:hypothetical protein